MKFDNWTMDWIHSTPDVTWMSCFGNPSELETWSELWCSNQRPPCHQPIIKIVFFFIYTFFSISSTSSLTLIRWRFKTGLKCSSNPTLGLHQVAQQLHQVGGGLTVDGEAFQLAGEDLQPPGEARDHPTCRQVASDPLAVPVENALAMNTEMADMDHSQEVQVITHQVRLG